MAEDLGSEPAFDGGAWRAACNIPPLRAQKKKQKHKTTSPHQLKPSFEHQKLFVLHRCRPRFPLKGERRAKAHIGDWQPQSQSQSQSQSASSLPIAPQKAPRPSRGPPSPLAFGDHRRGRSYSDDFCVVETTSQSSSINGPETLTCLFTFLTICDGLRRAKVSLRHCQAKDLFSGGLVAKGLDASLTVSHSASILHNNGYCE